MVCSTASSGIFLDLPPEIRNRIYELALGGNEVTPGLVRKKKDGIYPGRVARYTTDDELAMATFKGMILSCRAIQAETEFLLYSSNTFHVMPPFNGVTWIRLLGEKKRAAIRSIHLDYARRTRPWWDLNDTLELEYLREMAQRFATSGSISELPNLKLLTVRLVERDMEDLKQVFQDCADAKKAQVVFEELPLID